MEAALGFLLLLAAAQALIPSHRLADRDLARLRAVLERPFTDVRAAYHSIVGLGSLGVRLADEKVSGAGPGCRCPAALCCLRGCCTAVNDQLLTEYEFIERALLGQSRVGNVKRLQKRYIITRISLVIGESHVLFG